MRGEALIYQIHSLQTVDLSIDVELDFSISHIDVCVCCAQERPSQDERHLGVDFHVVNDEVDGNEEIPSLDRNVLCYSAG